VTPLLEGTGFYEMIDNKGVNGVSFAGGAEIVIYGQGMSHTPSSIQAVFTNKNLGLGTGQGGPPRPCKLDFLSCVLHNIFIYLPYKIVNTLSLTAASFIIFKVK